MLLPRKIDEDVIFLGGIDRRLQQFENMFELPYGVTYNSFLIMDEKTCVMDSVDNAVRESFFDGLALSLCDRKLDYFVVNHAEPDHAATITQLLDCQPECTLVTSKKCLDFLQQFDRRYDYSKVKVQIVEDGSILDLGKHKLKFFTAPNVHWPEVTVALDTYDGTLYSADAFGSFGAFDGYLFCDEVDYSEKWISENRRYYTNIVGRQGMAVQRLLKKFEGETIKRIFPLHGLLFRTPESIEMILDKYQHWSTYTAEEAGVVIIYGSMYQNSQEIADNFASMLAKENPGKIRVYDVSKTNISWLISDCFRFSHAVFVCNNYNTELYPKMDAFLRELMMLNWDNHKVTLLGNMSWGGRGLKIAEEILERAKNIEHIESGFTIKSSLAAEQTEELEKVAKAVAVSMKEFKA